MAKPYAMEMAQLSSTFEWALIVDIEPLQRAIRSASLLPLLAVGSGGSLTAANALVDFHRRFTGKLGAVTTPLEATTELRETAVSAWLLSAGGRNVDILAAAKRLITEEPSHLAVLCSQSESPLARIVRRHRYVDLLLYSSPSGKDGFLATNSLFAFVTLFARAYCLEFANDAVWARVVQSVRSVLNESSRGVRAWKSDSQELWGRRTTVVLHGSASKAAAIDLESKFTEAALGNVQVADFRNFAHGRHHWLAKRASETGILAFVTDDDRALADRTLNLLPSGIPQVRVDLGDTFLGASLNGLIAAFRLTGWAGLARGIDPGRPGVPDFGRRLYNLPLPVARRSNRKPHLSQRDEAAIKRKSGVDAARLSESAQLQAWRQALNDFRERMKAAAFSAIVLDYDGTLVDGVHRFDPVLPEVAAELDRLCTGEVLLAIATGRGKSVRRDLQQRLPPKLWDRIIIGYYNGAEVAPLSDNQVPDSTDISCEALTELAEQLRLQPELSANALQTNRRYQITLEPKRPMPENRLWDLANQVLHMSRPNGVTITRSSHSIDILSAGVSKLNVLAYLRRHVGARPILSIGDRGRWPGNDYELLREPFSLGVDEVNVDPRTCWNLAAPGQRGIAVTLEYLRALDSRNGTLRFAPDALT